MYARLAFDVIPCKVGNTMAACSFLQAAIWGLETEQIAGRWDAVSDLSLGSGLLAAENMAGTSDRVSFVATIQQKSSQW